MARTMDAEKQQAWRKRFQRFSSSGLVVAAFCEREGVSVPSFYQWRRKLAACAAESPPTPARNPTPAFVSVRMANPASASRAAARVEIRLPNGARVRVPVDQPQALEAALVAAGQAPTAGLPAAAAGEEGQPC